MSRAVHDKFVEIKIHTAKCDNCNKHNTSIIFRCQTCGQQCCTPCWQRKGGDDKHRLNGGDQGFTVAGEALGRRKRESRIVNEKRRAKRRTFMMDEDGDNKNDEDDNGEGYAEAVATIEKKAQVESLRETTKQSRHRFGRPSEAELTAASRKKIPEKKRSPSILTAADCSIYRAVPSRIHASITTRLRLRPHTRSIAASHQSTTPASTNVHSSIYISPYPLSASDRDGIMAILRAVKYMESDRLPSPSPVGASQWLSAPRDDKDEEEDGEWGQDAQARSPLFMPEDIDLNTQSDGGEAERRTQVECMVLRLDGAQDEVSDVDMDEEESSARRVPNRRPDKDDEYGEETDYEDWPRKISGAASGLSREVDEARDRDFRRATQREW